MGRKIDAARYQKTVRLFLDDKTIKEIAKEEGLSPNAIRNQAYMIISRIANADVTKNDLVGWNKTKRKGITLREYVIKKGISHKNLEQFSTEIQMPSEDLRSFFAYYILQNELRWYKMIEKYHYSDAEFAQLLSISKSTVQGLRVQLLCKLAGVCISTRQARSWDKIKIRKVMDVEKHQKDISIKQYVKSIGIKERRVNSEAIREGRKEVKKWLDYVSNYFLEHPPLPEKKIDNFFEVNLVD